LRLTVLYTEKLLRPLLNTSNELSRHELLSSLKLLLFNCDTVNGSSIATWIMPSGQHSSLDWLVQKP